MARGILDNDEDAADAIQDSILTCFEKIHTLKNPEYFKTWMIRIPVSYTHLIAIENAQKQGRKYRMDFPKSCVLYLRSGKNTPDFLEIEMVLSDEKRCV